MRKCLEEKWYFILIQIDCFARNMAAALMNS